MAQDLILEPGEVKRLPVSPHVPAERTPLIARTDDVVGTGEELLVLTPGKSGVKIVPYGAIFHDYANQSNIPILELPDGTTTDWHEEKEPVLSGEEEETV